MNWKSISEFNSWADTCIKSGHGGRVADAIREMNLAEIHQSDAVAFAKTARRVGAFSAGMKVLSRHIFDPGRERIISTKPQELAEYGALLMKNGSLDEALAVLGRIDPAVLPEVLLYQAFCRFARWEYTEATELLQVYSKSDLAPYERLVGHVNLASALVVMQRHAEALRLLDETVETAQKAGASRIVGNCLEMRGQVHFELGQIARCEEDLRRADQIFDDDWDRVYLDKRWAILKAHKTGSVEPFLEHRRFAISRRHWESVRDADFWRLRQEPHPETLNHLYFGTPHRRYRARIESALDTQTLNAETYVFGHSGGSVMDLRDEFAGLKPGSLPHRTLCVFLQDFYKPVNYGTLFAQVFPGEHFDPYSSPNRLRQVIRRVRAWLEDNEIPAVVEYEADYRLRLTGTFGFQVTRETKAADRQLTLLTRLKETCTGHEVTSREVAEQLHIHPAASKRLMRWAVEQKHAVRIGQGPAARYKLAG